MTDERSLEARLGALARRYDAMASGAAKATSRSAQDVGNYQRDAATLHEAAAMGVPAPAPSFRQTWPFALVFPDNDATPGGHNVRRPDGTTVFSQAVPATIAREACEALNQKWLNEA